MNYSKLDQFSMFNYPNVSMKVPPEWLYQYKLENPDPAPFKYSGYYYDSSKNNKDKSQFGTFNYYNENDVTCDMAYAIPSTEMIFRTTENLEEMNSVPKFAISSNVRVDNAINALKKQYYGEKANMRVINPPQGYRLSEFARDHSTMVQHG
jgi:hypothetical protein